MESPSASSMSRRMASGASPGGQLNHRLTRGAGASRLRRESGADGRMSVATSESVAENEDMAECGNTDVEGIADEESDDEDDDDDDEEEDEEDDDYDIYYNNPQDLDDDALDGGRGGGGSYYFNNNEDPEYFAYECLSVRDVEKMLQENVSTLCSTFKVSPSEAKLSLQMSGWCVEDALKKKLASTLSPSGSAPAPKTATLYCEVCAVSQPNSDFSHLSCKHHFCKACWEQHFECQIFQGISTSMSCMSASCDTLVPEDFVHSHVTKEAVRERYNRLAFQDFVIAHSQLRFCPGKNCKFIIRAIKSLPKRATCVSCKSSFCFQCGGEYHAPTDCETIKRWLTKCADDSETANYISAHTKDCPKCSICIEKNGGCNHMQCYNCKHEFCWMCLGDWKTHGSEYYECSRYKENPNIAHESAHAQAREALKKYLHYFERWENHSKSMRLEAQTLAKIRSRINEKVMGCCGTWIDWQYLLDAAALLAKCRYTLQYTYPYAYYMEPSQRKALFEYQQAQLEAEIENLSWKIEHAETTDRGDLENQIDIAEKRRTSLLKDFLPS